MQADAVQAYIQAELKGTETWVELPRQEWPKQWAASNVKRLVPRLRLALFGHPDAGGHWEAHCESHLSKIRFERVYVDDFKYAGPKLKLETGWKLSQQGLTLETPTPFGLYLGCKHTQASTNYPAVPLSGQSLTTWSHY